jgi:hypothetical protein
MSDNSKRSTLATSRSTRVALLLAVGVAASMALGCKWLGRSTHKDGGARAAASDDTTTSGDDPDLKGAFAELEKANVGLFDACDTSRNGDLSGAEIATCSAASYDTNKDGHVTRAEFLAGRGTPSTTAIAQKPSTTAVAQKPVATVMPTTATTPTPAKPEITQPVGGSTAALAGSYECFGIVSSRLQSLGQFSLDANGGYHLDAPKEGDFTYDPGTHTVKWLNGLYASKFRAGNLHGKQISMTTKDGFYQWDCDRS